MSRKPPGKSQGAFSLGITGPDFFAGFFRSMRSPGFFGFFGACWLRIPLWQAVPSIQADWRNRQRASLHNFRRTSAAVCRNSLSCLAASLPALCASSFRAVVFPRGAHRRKKVRFFHSIHPGHSCQRKFVPFHFAGLSLIIKPVHRQCPGTSFPMIPRQLWRQRP